MREIKQKSIVPVYGVAVVWVSYCAVFPLYKTWHFIALACTAALSYLLLSAIFPGKVKTVEVPVEPERTGDDTIDSLLIEGERAAMEMRRLRDCIRDDSLRGKVDEIICVIEKIFKRLLDSPDDYKQVKRFADFYLPSTIKLLHTYDRFGQIDEQGENITGTLARISSALDTIVASYRKFFDSLFLSQAIDIETDITVLKNMLRNEGLLEMK